MHFHVNPVNAIETIQELSACSVFQNVSVEPSTLPAPVSKPVCELFVCPVSVSEPFDDCFVFPAMVPKTVNAPPVLSVSALPVLSVSALPRSRSLPWFPAQSAFLCWSSVRSAPLRWPSAQVWWPSAPPWGSSAQVRWSSALPWRTSAPPWWAPVRSALVGSRSVRSAWGSSSLGGGAMSRILSMHFRSFTTRGHSLTTLTLALHELLHTISKYNYHHPLALTSHS